MFLFLWGDFRVHYNIDALKQYATARGRATRRQFWYFWLIDTVLWLGIHLVDGRLGTEIPEIVYGVATFLPSLAVTIRRLHDTGRSGWWFLVSIIPFVGSVWLLVMLAGKSSADESYGAYPGTADPLPAF